MVNNGRTKQEKVAEAPPKPVSGFLVIMGDDLSVESARVIASAIGLINGVIAVQAVEGDLDPERIIETRVRSDISGRLVKAFQEAVWNG